MKKIFNISIGLIVMEIIAGVLLYKYLPDLIPTHWGVSGAVDGYGAKYMVFLAPFMSIILTVIMYYSPRFVPSGDNILKSGNSYPALILTMNLLMLVIFVVTVLTAFGYSVPVGIIIPAAIGLMFVVLGVYMPKIKHNYMFGIRLPWTLANEEVWNKTHKLGGACFTAVGVLFVFGFLFPVPYNFVVPITALFLFIIFISIYAYKEYKKLS